MSFLWSFGLNVFVVFRSPWKGFSIETPPVFFFFYLWTSNEQTDFFPHFQGTDASHPEERSSWFGSNQEIQQTLCCEADSTIIKEALLVWNAPTEPLNFSFSSSWAFCLKSVPNVDMSSNQDQKWWKNQIVNVKNN